MKGKGKFLRRPIQVLLVCLWFGLGGCGQPVAGEQSFWLPWYSEGSYSWQSVTLVTPQSYSPLTGPAADIFMHPRFHQGKVSGTQVRTRWTIDPLSQVAIAKDLLSIQALVIYAHMERLMDFDQATGSFDLLSWPRKVALQARVVTDEGIDLQSNALYVVEYDAMVVVPYQQPDLPMTINGGILAHEHFHALFNQLVVKKWLATSTKSLSPISYLSQEREDSPFTFIQKVTAQGNEPALPMEPGSLAHRQRYNEMILRAWNEGLADFWSWLYLGDHEFVRRSRLDEGGIRHLNSTFDPLPADSYLQDLVATNRDEVLTRQAYRMGSSLARFLRVVLTGDSVQTATAEQRIQAAQTIIRALKSFAINTQEPFLPAYEVAEFILAHQGQPVSSSQCAALAIFIGERTANPLGTGVCH